jgi:hypothetical protein
MITALVKNASEVSRWIDDGYTGGLLSDDGGTLCTTFPTIGWTTSRGDDTYVLLKAEYADTQPANSIEESRTYEIVNGVVRVRRTWATAPTPAPLPLSPLDFRARFTDAEQAAIQTAALGNAKILGVLLEQASAQFIDTTDARTIEGVNALVTAGLLTPARAAQILAVS